MIGIIKGVARTLLHANEAPEAEWPYAVRSAVAHRFCAQSRRLGWSMDNVVPYNAPVHVLRRSWQFARGGEWKSRVVKARVLAPAREAKGYLVRTKDNELMTAPVLLKDLVFMDSPVAELPEQSAVPAESVQIPRHRVRGKSSQPVVEPAAGVSKLSHEFDEDEKAAQLAQAVPFDLNAARIFLLASQYIKGSSGKLRAALEGDEGQARVVGPFQHGGVTGVTKDTQLFPGFARLMVRIVQHVDPRCTYTTLALLSQTCSKPHVDRCNLPTSNLVLPLQVPCDGGGI